MRTVVGTMTGTSMDSVDAVAVSINGHGVEMTASFLAMACQELGTLSTVLRKLSIDHCDLKEMDRAAYALGCLTAKTIEQLRLDTIDLIALHGQTIHHKPPDSIQLIDPKPVVDSFSCTVLTDPRQADLKHGGQGAPITPIADWVMFRTKNLSTAIVNLGGFCNVTLLPANCVLSEIQGFDVCSCNLILDAIARDRLDRPFDRGGEYALSGTVDTGMYDFLLAYLEAQRHANRSLGSGDDLCEIVIEKGSTLTTADLAASTAAAIGRCITNSLGSADRVLLAGGGVNNVALCQSIRSDGTTEDFGVPTQAREAMGMAILGALAQDDISITLPQITGRQETSELVGWVQASP